MSTLRESAEAPSSSEKEARIRRLWRDAADLHDAFETKELLAIIAACLMEELMQR